MALVRSMVLYSRGQFVLGPGQVYPFCDTVTGSTGCGDAVFRNIVAGMFVEVRRTQRQRTRPRRNKKNQIVLDADGNPELEPVLEPKLDSKGQPISDDKGDPILLPVKEWYTELFPTLARRESDRKIADEVDSRYSWETYSYLNKFGFGFGLREEELLHRPLPERVRRDFMSDVPDLALYDSWPLDPPEKWIPHVNAADALFHRRQLPSLVRPRFWVPIEEGLRIDDLAPDGRCYITRQTMVDVSARPEEQVRDFIMLDDGFKITAGSEWVPSSPRPLSCSARPADAWIGEDALAGITGSLSRLYSDLWIRFGIRQIYVEMPSLVWMIPDELNMRRRADDIERITGVRLPDGVDPMEARKLIKLCEDYAVHLVDAGIMSWTSSHVHLGDPEAADRYLDADVLTTADFVRQMA